MKLMCGNLSDIYFEVDNEDALLESVMGEDKIAVTPLFLLTHFFPCFIHLMNLSVGDTDGLARVVVDSCVQHVIIGLDNTQVFADLDLSASATDFAQEDDDSDEDDDGSHDDEESDFDNDFNDVVRMNLKPLISVV